MREKRGERGRRGVGTRRIRGNPESRPPNTPETNTLKEAAQTFEKIKNETKFKKFKNQFKRLANLIYSLKESDRHLFLTLDELIPFIKNNLDTLLQIEKDIEKGPKSDENTLHLIADLKLLVLFSLLAFTLSDLNKYMEIITIDEEQVKKASHTITYQINNFLKKVGKTTDKQQWKTLLTFKSGSNQNIISMTIRHLLNQAIYIAPLAITTLFHLFDRYEVNVSDMINQPFWENPSSLSDIVESGPSSEKPLETVLSLALKCRFQPLAIEILLKKGADPNLLSKVENIETILVDYLLNPNISLLEVGVIRNILTQNMPLISENVGKAYLNLELNYVPNKIGRRIIEQGIEFSQRNVPLFTYILNRYPTLVVQESTPKMTFCARYLKKMDQGAITFIFDYLKKLKEENAIAYIEMLTHHFDVTNLIDLWKESGNPQIRNNLILIKEISLDIYQDMLCIKNAQGMPILFAFLSKWPENTDLFEFLKDEVMAFCQKTDQPKPFYNFFLKEENDIWLSPFHDAVEQSQTIQTLCYNYLHMGYLYDLPENCKIPPLGFYCTEKEAIPGLKEISHYLDSEHWHQPFKGQFPLEVALNQKNSKVLKILLEIIFTLNKRLGEGTLSCKVAQGGSTGEICFQINVQLNHPQKAFTYSKPFTKISLEEDGLSKKAEGLNLILATYSKTLEKLKRLAEFLYDAKGLFEVFYDSLMFDSKFKQDIYSSIDWRTNIQEQKNETPTPKQLKQKNREHNSILSTEIKEEQENTDLICPYGLIFSKNLLYVEGKENENVRYHFNSKAIESDLPSDTKLSQLAQKRISKKGIFYFQTDRDGFTPFWVEVKIGENTHTFNVLGEIYVHWASRFLFFKIPCENQNDTIYEIFKFLPKGLHNPRDKKGHTYFYVMEPDETLVVNCPTPGPK